MTGPQPHGPTVEAVEATAFWLAAKHWLGVWARDGFKAKVDGDRILMPAGFPERFPDGPHLIDLLRKELIGLLTHGNEAVKLDPRLSLHLEGPIR